MNANKPASARTLKSDLKRVDAHKVKPNEYKDLPELTDAMLKRGVVNAQAVRLQLILGAK